MPLYRTMTTPGLLDDAQRERFANDVVEVHCDVTGAPRSFVHVLYLEDDRGALGEGQQAMVAGTIRHGRSDEQRQEIADRLTDALAEVAGVETDAVSVMSVQIQASYTMEGGTLLPEPGSAEEEAWKAQPSETAPKAIGA